MSAYFETLGRDAVGLPDISKTNYLQTEVDMSESVNKNIDETTEANEAHFNQLISIYKHMDERAQKAPSRWEKLIKTGIKTDAQFREFEEYLGNVNQYKKKFLDYKDTTTKFPKLVEESGLTADQHQAQALEDKDLTAEANAKNNRDVVRNEANALVEEVKDVDVDAAYNLQEPYIKEQLVSENIAGLRNMLPQWRIYAQHGMKVHHPSFGHTPEGKPIYKAYNDPGTTLEDKQIIGDIIDAHFFQQHEGVAKGRLGLYKKDFLNKALELGRARDVKLQKESVAALDEAYKTAAGKELKHKLKTEGGQAFVTMITTEMPRFKDPITGLPSARLAREAIFNFAILHRSRGDIDDVDVKAIGDAWVQPYHAPNTPPPPKQKVRDFWKKDFKRLKAASAKAQKEEFEERELIHNGEKKDAASTIYDWATEEDRTYKQVQKALAGFDADWGTTPETRPDLLKNLEYQNRDIDEDLDGMLTARYTNDDISTLPSQAEINSFTSDALKEKWQNRLDAGTGLRKGTDGAGTIGFRNTQLRSIVNVRTKENFANTESATPLWNNMYNHAQAEYMSVYRSLKSEGVSDTKAHAAAEKSVVSNLYDPKIDWTVPIHSTGDNPLNDRVLRKKAQKLILKDRDLIDTRDTPFEGEEPHLKAGLAYKQGKGKFPAYYELMTRDIKRVGREELLNRRLIANGLMKDGEIVSPEKDNLDLVDARKLEIKPTAGNTYKITQDNPDYTWMLNTVQNKESLKNGGYLALKDQDGKWTNIEAVTGKTIDQITYGDVSKLAIGGYSHFGMYGLTAQGVVDIVESGQVPLDASWDKKGQDFLLLARLRQKTQQAQQNTGINTRYRRLVNIRAEDKERFKTIAGDLPPWLQLDTLLPECAKELCNAQLQ